MKSPILKERSKEKSKVGNEHEPLRGAIALVLNNREVVVNRGLRDGVTSGMKFLILDPRTQNIRDPETGEQLGSIPKAKISVEVTEVEDRVSIARTFRRIPTGDLLSGVARVFQQTGERSRWETLRANPGTEPLNEEQSLVKVGDPVIEVIESVSEAPETDETAIAEASGS
jgi:hypothetical protein